MSEATLQLFDPRNGDLALRIQPLAGAVDLSQQHRFNQFTIIWIQQGSGACWIDSASYEFQPGIMLFLNPYQAFRLAFEHALQGVIVQFHANFLCIETYHEAIGCNGVLFNDVYGMPLVTLDAENEQHFAELVENLRKEIQLGGLAHSELLLSYMKIFLVRATRLKLQQQAIEHGATGKKPAQIEELQRLIELHYRTKHSPAEYADLLHMTSKAIAKLVKTHLRKTLSELIRERILKQAKWDLLHTSKQVKLIAGELGFDDELYFSRLFKQGTGLAPTAFREFETAIRNEASPKSPSLGVDSPFSK
jgi:AraC-like DNA-binding protein